MKKITIILAMLLIAATSYNQSSRRTANGDQTAQRKDPRSNNASVNSSDQQRSNSTQSGSRQSNVNSNGRTREAETSVNRQHPATSTSTDRSSTRTNRNANHSVNSRTVRSGEPQTVNTDSHRSTSNAPARASESNRTVYASSRQYRSSHAVSHYYHKPPPNAAYRAEHYAYRVPVSVNVIWTPTMHRHYVRMYPMVTYWRYNSGYRISNVSAYYADYYMGDVMTVYGRVLEVYYSNTTDEYFLYFGAYYPYQDFTVVMPGWVARQYSRRPDRYFDNNYIAVTGLITSYEGKPEIVVKESFQLNLY